MVEIETVRWHIDQWISRDVIYLEKGLLQISKGSKTGWTTIVFVWIGNSVQEWPTEQEY